MRGGLIVREVCLKVDHSLGTCTCSRFQQILQAMRGQRQGCAEAYFGASRITVYSHGVEFRGIPVDTCKYSFE